MRFFIPWFWIDPGPLSFGRSLAPLVSSDASHTYEFCILFLDMLDFEKKAGVDMGTRKATFSRL
jgi:hypothetical protein